MRRPALATCTAAAALALACGADRDPRPAAETTTAGKPVTPTAHDSLTLDLLVAPEVRSGTPVRFVVRIVNRGSHPLDLYLRGRTITVDVEVARPGGETVWRRLAGEIIPAIVHLRTLAAGERLEVEVAWETPAGPGEYAARGFLLVEGDPLATPSAAFRIVAR